MFNICYGMNVWSLLTSAFGVQRPQNSYFEILPPNVIVLGVRVFGRQLGHEGGTLINGISVLTLKRPQRALSALHHENT